MKPGDIVYVRAEVIDATDPTDVRVKWVDANHNDFDEAYFSASNIIEPREKDAQFRVGSNAPDTSKTVEPLIAQSSLQMVMLSHFEDDHKRGMFSLGFTDDELEGLMNRSHQSVSATRNTLTRKGLLEATAERRETRSGNPAIVWRRTAQRVVVR